MKKIAVFIAIGLLIGLFFGFAWGKSQLSGTVSNNASRLDTSKAQTVSLMLDYGDGKVRVYPDIALVSGQSLLELLEKQAKDAKLTLKTKDFGELGILVEQIGDKVNGEGGKYWQYWVNNVSIPRSSDSYILSAGDVIEWKFLNYK